jgi:hypothetical protein
MKKIAILAFALLAATGCASVRQFTLTVDPPDAKIDVIASGNQPGTSYRSPANIPIPADPAKVAQSRIVISRENYKTMVLLLSSVQGDGLRIALQKTPQTHYHLKYSLATPVRSDDLTLRDKILGITIVFGDQHIDLKIDNLTRKPLTILWDKSDYTDVMNQSHRLVPSGIKGENRGNHVPPQTIPVGGSLQESVMPESSITYSGGGKGYVVKPLFDLDSDSALSLKDKTVSIFLPVTIDGALIPNYNLSIKIDDVIKDKAP